MFFSEPKINDIHLQWVEEKGGFSWHITEKDRETLEKKYKMRGSVVYKELAEQLIMTLKNWTRRYHGNQRAFVFSEELRNCIGDAMLPKEGRHQQISLDSLTNIDKSKINEDNYLKKTRIRDLPRKPPLAIAWILDDGILRYVLPITDNYMLCFSDLQSTRFMNLMMRKLGMEEYQKYVEKIVKQKVRNNLKLQRGQIEY